MAVVITLNGTTWTTKINDLSVQVKEAKQSYTNLKGDGITVPPRAQVSGMAVKATFSFLSRADYLALKVLYELTTPFACTFSGLDVPSGNYIVTEFTDQRVKSLTNVVYNVIMVLQQDSVAHVPAPVLPVIPLTSTNVQSKLGL